MNFCFLLTSENNFSASMPITHDAVVKACQNGDPDSCFSLYSDYRYNNIYFTVMIMFKAAA